MARSGDNTRSRDLLDLDDNHFDMCSQFGHSFFCRLGRLLHFFSYSLSDSDPTEGFDPTTNPDLCDSSNLSAHCSNICASSRCLFDLRSRSSMSCASSDACFNFVFESLTLLRPLLQHYLASATFDLVPLFLARDLTWTPTSCFCL